MHYLDYVSWLLAEHGRLVLETGTVEVGPLHNPTFAPSSPPWNMDWLVKFHDSHHVQIKERWFPETRVVPRGANVGYRKHFSFHYGTTNPAVDVRGFPLRDPRNFPPIFRIDCDRHGPHIHFHGNSHITQNRVQGLTIKNVDPFDFMKAVNEHRANAGKDFDAIMGFKVV